MLWFRVPPKIYFKRGAVDQALRELEGKKRAFIVTDRYLFDSGTVNNVTRVLEEMNIDYQIFFDVKPDPTLSTIDEALTQKLHFGMLQNVYLRILDDRDGREILSYPLGNAFENVTSMTLGELYLHQGQWKFNPVGNGVHMDLAGQCALYGVTLA